MFGAVRLFLAAALPLALLAPAAAQAAPVASPVKPAGQAALMKPLTLTKLSDMDFGNLGVTANGTAVINAVTDTMTTTGGVLLGGTRMRPCFRGVARAIQWSTSDPERRHQSDPGRRHGNDLAQCLHARRPVEGAMAQAGVRLVGATLRPTVGQVEGVHRHVRRHDPVPLTAANFLLLVNRANRSHSCFHCGYRQMGNQFDCGRHLSCVDLQGRIGARRVLAWHRRCRPCRRAHAAAGPRTPLVLADADQSSGLASAP